MLVVLETLTPARTPSFVLHDMFAVPFDEIAPLVDRSPQAAAPARASRARRRVRGAAPRRAGVDADRPVWGRRRLHRGPPGGDFDGLVAPLDPDFVVRADGGTALAALSAEVHSAAAVAAQASLWSQVELGFQLAMVDGAAGVAVTWYGAVFAVVRSWSQRQDHRHGFPGRPGDRLAGLDLAGIHLGG